MKNKNSGGGSSRGGDECFDGDGIDHKKACRHQGDQWIESQGHHEEIEKQTIDDMDQKIIEMIPEGI